MKNYYMGIDIGTSACKTALFAKDGKVKASSSRDYPVYYPKPGWAEQNPDEWWEAVCDSIKKVLASGGVRPAQIAGIGIDGQSWAAIAVDKDGEVLANTPIWMDTRAQSVCDRVNREIGADEIFGLCGNMLRPSVCPYSGRDQMLHQYPGSGVRLYGISGAGVRGIVR